VPEPVLALFDEWAACFARGERPDLRDYLARAGDGADELAGLVDAWLARAEPPAPDEDAVLLAQAWIDGETAVLALRRRRGLGVDQVVDFLLQRFGLDPSRRKKVGRCYGRVESGDLIPADGGLVAALADLLSARAADLFPRPRPLGPAQAAPAALYRSAPVMSAKLNQPAAMEYDEIDHLFRPR
jgi:hypothetical protein